MRGTWLAAAVALAAGRAVEAQISYVSQQRVISATGPGGGPTVTHQAPDFGPWSDSVASDGPAGGTSTASLGSQLAPGQFSFAGSASPARNALNQIGSASADVNVVFDVTVACSFDLTFNFDYASISLTGPGTAITSNGPIGGDHRTGTLAVGRYTLTAHTSGTVQAGRPSPGDMSLTLAATPLPVPVTTAFTYQGKITQAGAPVEGTADLRFRAYVAAEGSGQVGPTLELAGAAVHGGLVAAQLDFGPVFAGDKRFLEIDVRSPAGSGDYVTLRPRQEVTVAPQAGFAMTAPWSGITGVPANVSGAFSPFTADANGVSCVDRKVGVKGPAVTTDSMAVWGGLTVDAGARSTNQPPQAGTEFLGVRFGGETSGEAIGSSRTAPNNPFGLDFFTARAPRMSITQAGRVGIGTGAPDQLLTVNGNASKPAAALGAAYCDRRLKEDVHPMEGTLDRLLTLHGYRYQYTHDAVASGKALPGEQLGLMADEVERVFPDWVSLSPDGYRMVTERSITALMVEALRDLRAEKDREVRELRAELAERDRRLEEATAEFRAWRASAGAR